MPNNRVYVRPFKYGNAPTVVDGIKFDSKKESKRYSELILMQKAGRISDLKLQVQFELIPAQKDDQGKTIEQACYYRADFVYMMDGDQVVEDTKGYKTPEYVIKRKLMLHKFGIRIKEI